MKTSPITPKSFLILSVSALETVLQGIKFNLIMKRPLLIYVQRLICVMLLTFTAVAANAQLPTVLTVNPSKGAVATDVTLTGTNFNTDITKDVVFFGTVQATVKSVATNGSSMVVTVPKGAGAHGISVTNLDSKLTGYANKLFNVIFSNDGQIDFTEQSFLATGVSIPEQVICADFNLDGKPDVVIAEPFNVIIYRNTTVGNANATFANPIKLTTGGLALNQKIAVGDFNGDGLADVAASLTSGGFVYGINTSTAGQQTVQFGALTTVAAGGAPSSIMVGDLNSDGKPDIAITETTGDNIQTYTNTTPTGGTVSFFNGVSALNDPLASGVFGFGPHKVLIQDLNNDGIAELIVSNQMVGSANLSIFKGIGPNTYTLSSNLAIGASAEEFAIADVNDDGTPDLIIPNQFGGVGRVSIYANKNNLLFNLSTNVLVPSLDFPAGVVLADVDGDGSTDLLIKGSNESNVAVLQNTGLVNGIPTYKSTGNAITTQLNLKDFAVADVDLDGKPDIIALDNQLDRLSFLTNSINPNLAPTITKVDPLSGKVGDVVTLTGTNFGPTGSNVVFFGATKAEAVGIATSTSLQVVVPSGANFDKLTLTNTTIGLSATADKPFGLVYDGGANAVFANAKTYPSGASHYSGALAEKDFNGDGKPDLAFIGDDGFVGSYKVTVMLNDGTGSYTNKKSFPLPADFIGQNGLVAEDFDGDGNLDIAVNEAVPNAATAARIFVFRNKGVGNLDFDPNVEFSLPLNASEFVIAPVAGDLDRDGKMDIVLGTTTGRVLTFRNTSVAGALAFFNEAPIVSGLPNITSAAIGDLDEDGIADVVITDRLSSTFKVLHNSSAPGLVKLDLGTSFTGHQAYAMAIVDLDNDGLSDLVISSPGYGISMFKNTNQVKGVLSLSIVVDLDALDKSQPESVSVGDIDGDGLQDVVARNYDENTAFIYINKSVAGAVAFNKPVGYALPHITAGGQGYLVVGDVDGDSRPDLVSSNAILATISVLKNIPFVAPPTITKVDPLSGKVGDVVTLTGTNFGPTGSNVVFFGATKAEAVGIASATSLQVVVPSGANFDKLTLTNTTIGLSATADKPFGLVYDGGANAVFANAKTYPSGASHYSGALAEKDFNGDGKPDLAFIGDDGFVGSYKVTVMLNDGTGSYTNKKSFPLPADFIGQNGLVAEDFDGDGNLDIAVNEAVPNAATAARIFVFRNKGVGNLDFDPNVEFSLPLNASEFVIAPVAGDLDRDGKMDIVLGTTTGRVLTFRNTSVAGALAFFNEAPIVSGLPNITSAAIGDLDEDGIADVVITDRLSSTFKVLHNSSAPGLVKLDLGTSFTGHQAYAMAIVDLDNDGLSDLVISSPGYGISMFKNTNQVKGVLSLSIVVDLDALDKSQPESVSVGDIDGDGLQDVVARNYDENTAFIYINKSVAGAVAFNKPVGYALPHITAGGQGYLVVGDVDGDSRPDLVSSNAILATISVLKNIPFVAPPTITQFTPTTAKVGDQIKITGTNFSTDATRNSVFFGATKATVLSATATEMTVKLPFGANYQYVTETNLDINKTGASAQPFELTIPVAVDIDFETGKPFTVGIASKPSTMAVGDLNNDGVPDIVVGSPGKQRISILLNQSNKIAFTTQIDLNLPDVAAIPTAVAIGDLDGDGHPDIAVTAQATNMVYVYQNSGNPNNPFTMGTPFPTGTTPLSIAIGDLDKDGLPELVISNYFDKTLSILKNTSEFGGVDFAPKQDITFGAQSPLSVALGDLDNDGWIDVVLSFEGINKLSVFHNTSTFGALSLGTISNLTTTNPPKMVTLGDMDGDGKMDIVTAVTTTVDIFTNTNTTPGTASFSAHPELAGAFGVLKTNYFALGDLDGDGRTDLVTANGSLGTTSVFRNTTVAGSLNFEKINDYLPGTPLATPEQIVIDDVDGDGRPDFISLNRFNDNISVYKNKLEIPVILSISPKVSALGTQVTITGKGFNIDPAKNIVFFGATRALVQAVASPEELTVLAPLGADYNYVTLTNTAVNLTAQNNVPFGLTYGSTGPISFTGSASITGLDMPHAFLSKDLNGDGLVDFVTADDTPTGKVLVYINSSTATSVSFLPAIELMNAGIGFNPKAIKAADFDGDGLMDIVVAMTDGNNVNVFLNETLGTNVSFATALSFTTDSGPKDLQIADFDRDGKLDIASININATVSFLRNASTLGYINFDPKTDSSVPGDPISSTIGEALDAGNTNLLISTGANTFTIFDNASATPGNLAVTKSQIQSSIMHTGQVKFADVDGDLIEDLVYTNLDNDELVIQLGLLGGVFGTPTSYSLGTNVNPSFIAIGDVNGDGHPDVAVTIADNNTMRVFANNPASPGAFLAPLDFAIGANAQFGALEDVNGDGKLDLMTADYIADGNVSILLNSQLIAMDVITENPTAITATGATLNSSVRANISDVTVSFEYGLSPTLMNPTTQVATTNPTVTAGTGFQPSSATLNGLVPGTYYYRAVGVNTTLDKAFGQIKTFDIAGKVNSITATDANPNNGQTGMVAYKVTFSSVIAGLQTSNFILNKTGSITGSTITSVAVDGVNPNAWNVFVNIGTGGSGTLTLQMNNSQGMVTINNLPFDGDTYVIDKTPPAVPQGLAADAADATTKVTWTANTETDLKEYIIYGGTNINALTALVTIPAGTTTHTFTGLTNGTTYYYSISAKDLLGNESAQSGAVMATPQVGQVFKQAQTITFGALGTKVYGDADFDLGALASSGLAVDYTSSNQAVATIVGGKLHIVGVGSVTIYAEQGGNASFAAAGLQQQQLTVTPMLITLVADAKSKLVFDNDPALSYHITQGSLVGTDQFTGALKRIAGEAAGDYDILQNDLSITNLANYTLTYVGAKFSITNKAPQNLVFNVLANKIYGDADFTLNATTDPGLTITYSCNDPTIATVSGNVVHIVKFGTVMITADQPGNATIAAAQVVQALIIMPRPLTVTADDKVINVGDTEPPLTYQLSAGFVTGDPVTGSLKRAAGTSAGVYLIGQSTLDFGPNYSVTYVPGNFTITNKALQVINFIALPAKTYGDADFALTATSDKGLVPVTFSSSDPTIASISGNMIHILHAGTVTITADQAGDNNTAAGQQTQNLTINPFAVTVTADAKSKYVGQGDPALTYQSSPALVGAGAFTGFLTRDAGTGAGTYAIRQGSVALNPDYLITYVGANLTILNKASQTISFGALPAKVYGDADFNLTATTNSGLPIAYTSSNPAIATVTGNAVHIVHAGSVIIYADQSGDATTAAAVQQAQTLTIAKRVISVVADAKTKFVSDPDPAFTYAFTGSLVGADVFSGSLVRIGGTAVGQYDINQGSLAISADYSINYTGAKLTISNKNSQFISFPALPNQTYGDADLTLSATSTSGLLVSYTSSNPLVATVVGNVVHIVGVGTVTISADQVGDANYFAALSFQRSFTVSPMLLTVTALPQEKAISTADPILTYKVSTGKLVGADQFSGSLSRAPGEQLGNYAINQGNLSLNANYVLSFVPANFLIRLKSIAEFKLRANNILTPNDDGKNDVLKIEDLEQYPPAKITIVDRAGRILYQTDHYLNNWNGVVNGSVLATDTYYYILDFGKGYGYSRNFVTIVNDK